MTTPSAHFSKIDSTEDISPEKIVTSYEEAFTRTHGPFFWLNDDLPAKIRQMFAGRQAHRVRNTYADAPNFDTPAFQAYLKALDDFDSGADETMKNILWPYRDESVRSAKDIYVERVDNW